MEKPSTPSKVAQKIPKKKKKRVENYEMYIYRVHQKVKNRLRPREIDDPEGGSLFFPPVMGISRKAISIMNSFVTDLFERLAGEASMLTKSAKTETFTSWPIQKALKLVLPYELGEFAERRGLEAVNRFLHDYTPLDELR
ncbi:histone H2B-like [Cryptomeria japonica]|uniref:histone H2B-like n=1 Tax=Cryptomeria japonica TaxID=3369 RepID=UPI0025AD96E6|nr:histone H2B-like [Cryptomeria japonica]